jgi:hypothetical protein
MSSNDSFLQTILAMDSYHRDKGGFRLERESIGPANYIDSIEREAFAATAYRFDTKIVISYRGTDNPGPFTLDNDVSSGWVAGAGWSRATQVGQ